MEILIIILVIVVVAYVTRRHYNKWYEKLPTEEKSVIKELELKLKDINPKIENKMDRSSLFLYKELYNLSKNLIKNEEIIFFTSTMIADKFDTGYVYVTNKRVLVKVKKYEKSIPLEKISSIDTGNKMGRNWIRINVNLTAILLDKIPKQDILRLKEEINNGMQKHKNVSIDITQTTEKDIADKISRLRVLYEEGVLTEYEFSMKKLELLDKMK